MKTALFIIGGVLVLVAVSAARVHALNKYGADSPQYKRLFLRHAGEASDVPDS